MMSKKGARLEDYVLTYMVGPLLPEWWSSLFALGFGIIVTVLGAESLALTRFFLEDLDWFTVIARGFGIAILAAGLIGFVAVHGRFAALRIASGATICVLLTSYITVMIVVGTAPWLSIWMFATHVALEGLVMLRLAHKLTEW